MSEGLGRFTRRKAILLGLLVLVLAAVIVAVWALRPPDEHVLMFGGYCNPYPSDDGDPPDSVVSPLTNWQDLISGQTTTVFVVRPADTVQDDARGVMEHLIGRAVLRNKETSRANMDHDASICYLSLDLKWETHSPSCWKTVLNWANGVLGRPFAYPIDSVVAVWHVGQSDRLWFRLTPKGQFYISTADDRKHMVHAHMLDDDPNLAYGASKICQDHWADWEKKVDELAKASAPDKGKR